VIHMLKTTVLHVITAFLVVCEQFCSLCDCTLLAHKAETTCKVNSDKTQLVEQEDSKWKGMANK
jgi:hypothetical protein